jgi:signal peptidase I
MKPRGWIVGLAVVAAFEVAIYLVNPLHTASHDPRLRLWGIGWFRIPSPSMEPTLHRNSIFLVSAWPYLRAAPRSGDIIVFKYPLDPSVSYVKRVIAAGGSKVEIRDGLVLVDDRQLAEPYETGAHSDRYSRTYGPVQVPADDFFVLGDNRPDSADSRAWGFIPRANIIGRVIR